MATVNIVNQRAAAARTAEAHRALARLRPRVSGPAHRITENLEPAARTGALPLSFQQERLWFAGTGPAGRPARATPIVLRLLGPLDVIVLRNSIARIVARHEVLRTRFAVAYGVPYQLVDPAPAELALPVEDFPACPADDEHDDAVRTRIAALADEPVDLLAGPLLRTLLLRLAEDRHLLVVAAPPIVMDGYSRSLLAEEIAAVYAAYPASPHGRLPVQYADFAVWQRTALSGDTLDARLGYWRRRLHELPDLDLPTDFPRPPSRTWATAAYQTALPATLYQRVRALSGEAGTTLLATLLTGLLTVLEHYTHQDDIVVGSEIDERTRPETEPLIGQLANRVVLRTEVSGNPTFRELMKRADETVVDALASYEVPFGKLVDALPVAAGEARNPLFQVSLTVRDGVRSAPAQAGELALEDVPQGSGTATTDLAVEVIGSADGRALIRAEYATELFRTDRIAALLRHLLVALDQMVADPDRRIGRCELLSDAEREQVTRKWNPAPAPHDTDGALLHQLFETQAAARPDHPAVRFAGSTLSYRALDEEANRLAGLCRQRWRIGPDTVVALLLDRGPQLPLAQLAVLKAGGAFLPLDAQNPGDRLAFQIGDAKAAVTITTSELVDKLPAGTPALCLDHPETVRALRDQSRRAPAIDTRPDHLAYLIYTSGSTGRPKGVLISHRSVVNFVSTMRDLFAITAQDRVLQFANPAFDVSVFDLYAALGCGATVVGAPRTDLLDPRKLTALVRDEQVSIADLPPAVLRQLDPAEVPSLRTLFVGLEPFPGELVNRWTGAGREFHNGYGPTEATVACIDYRCPTEELRDTPPIGRAMANHRAYLLDRHLNLVPVGVTGELYVAGVGLARGYLNQPALTEERFRPDPYGEAGQRMYRTGDLARWRPDGNLEFVGRADNQIKIRGLRIEPGEIEYALQSQPDVTAAAVVAHRTDGGAAQLVGYVVPAAAAEPPDTDDLRERLARHLPPHMVPSTIVVLESLPLTANGKLDRKKLPEPAAARRTAPGPSEPTTPTQRKLVEILGDVLEIGSRRIGLEDSYFDLNGNSLNLIQFLARVKDAFGVTLDSRQVLLGPRVEQIAAAVEEHQAPAGDGAAGGDAPWLVTIRADGSKPPLFCVHPSGGSVVPYVPLAQLIEPQRPMYGLEAVRLHGAEPATDVAEMARGYVHAIRTVQPSGPYHLAGWSVGGTIAFAMARRLRAEGDEVALLLLLDCAAPPALPEPPRHHEMLASFVHDLAGLQSKTEPPLDWARLATTTDDDRENEVLRQLEAAGLIPANVRDDVLIRIHAFLDTVRATLTYRPERYDGAIVALAATGDEHDYEGGWDGLTTGTIREVPVPGTHYTMLQPPLIKDLAAIVQRHLDEAEQAAE